MDGAKILKVDRTHLVLVSGKIALQKKKTWRGPGCTGLKAKPGPPTLSLDVQDLGHFAGDQKGGYSGHWVPQRTVFQKGPKW